MDYNGTGKWSASQILDRYARYAALHGLDGNALQQAEAHAEGDKRWLFPLMLRVIPLAEKGDPAALELALEMIEEDDFFCLGMVTKSNCARALRRAELTPAQQDRVRRRIVAMLLAGWVPQEFREYKRLLRKVGLGELWPVVDAEVDRENPYVMRHYKYLSQIRPGCYRAAVRM